MKKLFFAALLMITAATSTFAKDVKKVDYRILSNFKSEYKNAQDVSWTMRNNFTKAAFTINGEKMEAFYDLQGNVIGTSRNISLNELPVSAKRIFAKKYDGYTVKEAIRFDGVDESAYYISAENDKESVILKVSDTFGTSVFKKESKN